MSVTSDEHIELFGAWTLTTISPIPALSAWQLELQRTDGSDGTYQLADDQPVSWLVSGGSWTLGVLTYFHFPTGGWSYTHPRRSKFTEPDGDMVVRVEAYSASDIYPLPPPLILRCVYQSPHPFPTGGPPFDFTIPET